MEELGRIRERLILLSFGLSTAASLIFEVIWSRELTYVFGSSAYAISTVLTSFMAGLALGSFVYGRLADRITNPMRLFAYLQVGIGIYGLLTLIIFEILQKPYLFLHQLFGNSFYFYYAEFLMSFTALLLPSTFMGGSFPVVGRILARYPRDVGKRVGDVYSLDSLGAAIGSFTAGVILVPTLGHSGAIMLASSLCLSVGIVMFVLSQNVSIPAAKRKKGIVSTLKSLSKFDKIILFSFYLSGYAALTYELVWTRLLSLVFGTGTYAFSVMLTAYFSGLMLGSYLMGRYIDRVKSPIVYLALLEIGIGLSGLILLPVFPELDMPYLAVRKLITSPYLVMASWVLIPSFLLMPTAMMGATLPIVSKLLARGRGKIGADLGMVFSANTIGGISGAWWTGFVLIPYLGIEKTTVLAAVSNLGAALLVFNYAGDFGKRFIVDVARGSPQIRKGFYASFLIAITMSIFYSAYNMDSTYAGIYYVAKSIPMDVWKDVKQNQVEIFEQETLYGYVHVWDLWGNRYFAINGKVEASTMVNDLSTQYLLSYLPMLVHNNPRRILNIGMGTGITLSRVGVFDVEGMTTVEINPVVVKVANEYFSADNLGILGDPRAKVVIEDARNFLATDKGIYDVVISDPQDVWNSGSSALFTVEYYSLVRDHLDEGGIFVQYITSADYTPRDFKILLNTIHRVFPYISLWESANTLFILASMEHVALDYARIKDALKNPQFRRDIELISGGRDPMDYLASRQVMNEDEVKEFIVDVEVVNTDDRPLLEYSTNMNMLRSEYAMPYHAILDFKRESIEAPIVVPSVINHVDRSNGSVSLEFMGLRIPLDEEWRKVFTGYVFEYKEHPYSRFPPGYHKIGVKNARFEKRDAELEIKVYPLESLIGPARGELLGLVNTALEKLVRDFLSERGERIELLGKIHFDGDAGYIITASSGVSGSDILVLYCGKRREIYFVTLKYSAHYRDNGILSSMQHHH